MLLDAWSMSPFYFEKPDATCPLADNDMNTWQSVSVSDRKGWLLPADAQYVIYRNVFTPHKEYQEEGGTLLFKSVAGKAEFWLNGKLIGKKEDVNERDFKLQFPVTKGECDLRVLLHSSPKTHVGLKGLVMLQTR